MPMAYVEKHCMASLHTPSAPRYAQLGPVSAPKRAALDWTPPSSTATIACPLGGSPYFINS